MPLQALDVLEWPYTDTDSGKKTKYSHEKQIAHDTLKSVLDDELGETKAEREKWAQVKTAYTSTLRPHTLVA